MVAQLGAGGGPNETLGASQEGTNHCSHQQESGGVSSKLKPSVLMWEALKGSGAVTLQETRKRAENI